MGTMLQRREINIEPLDKFQFSKRGSALIGQKMFIVLESARRLEEQGKRIYHLELGNSRLPPPSELVRETIQSLKNEEVGYSYSAGHPALRQTVAKHFSEGNRPLSEKNVVISPANLLINQFLDLVCNPGDKVVFFTPAFPTYWAAAAHIGLHVEQIPLDPGKGFDLSDENVARAIALRPRAIIVNSANNPTGSVYGKAALHQLANACEEHGIWLLSDETYGPISFGKEFTSLIGLDLPHLVVMSSFSKIFSVPGFRTGFAIAHEQVAEKLSLSTSTLISCLPIFTQRGCAAAMASFKSYTKKVTERCANITSWCTETLQHCQRIKFNPPQAGFYFFIDIAASGLDDLTFSKRLLQEEMTAITPGSSFGAAFSGFVRIATCGNEDDVREGTRRLVNFVERL